MLQSSIQGLYTPHPNILSLSQIKSNVAVDSLKLSQIFEQLQKTQTHKAINLNAHCTIPIRRSPGRLCKTWQMFQIKMCAAKTKPKPRQKVGRGKKSQGITSSSWPCPWPSISVQGKGRQKRNGNWQKLHKPRERDPELQ